MLDRPLRFALVTTFYPPYHFGGDAICVYRLTEALASRGHRVDVIHSIDAYRLRASKEPQVSFRHHPNVRCHGLETKRPALSALAVHQLGRPGPYYDQIRSLLQEIDPDVIHFHNVSLLGGPGLLEQGRGVKLYTAHEYWLVCPTHVLYRYGREPCASRTCWRCTLRARRPVQLWRHGHGWRRSLREVSLFLMPSRFCLEKHREIHPDLPMRVLPHFVPVAGASELPGIAGNGQTWSDRPFFLFVGRLEVLKGIEDLLDLFVGAGANDLVVAGDGSLAEDLRLRTARLPRVHLLGAVHPDRLPALYQRAVACIVPSRCYETFGMSMAESLARGTPVIARGQGALLELIEASGAGIAFSTPEECRAAMDRLSANSTERAALGERGLRAARMLWSEEHHLNTYLEWVHQLMQRSRP